MKMSRAIMSLMGALFMLLAAPVASAQGFGDLLKALTVPQAQRPPIGAQQSPISQGQPGFGAKLTENYCRNLYSVASMEAQGPINENLISEEFNLDPKDFYDEFFKAQDAKPGYASYAFPGLAFYQNEFETEKISVIFDLLLSYPSPKYAAALIAESRATPGQPRYDGQIKADAVAALAMLHFRMQDKSKSPSRWWELISSLQNEEHYTAYVIWARLYMSGEAGTRDATKAIMLSREANGLPGSYRQNRDLGKKMSAGNYAVTSNQTMYETFVANPNHPDRVYYADFLRKYGKVPGTTLPEVQAQIVPGLAAIEKSSRAAAASARLMLTKASEAGNINAQKASLDSALRNRVSDAPDYNSDQRTMAALARELEKLDKLDASQAKLLGDAMNYSHETGDRAVSMMVPMLSVAMNVMMNRGMEALPGLMPYAKKLQLYSNGACSVIARIDHTVMVKKLTPVDPERSGLASMVATK